MLESCHPRYGIKVAPVAFEPLYGLSVYDQAAEMMREITINKPALQMAAWHLELFKARDQFTSLIHRHDGPAFMPFPN